jgi:hypothetical protein
MHGTVQDAAVLVSTTSESISGNAYMARKRERVITDYLSFSNSTLAFKFIILNY